MPDESGSDQQTTTGTDSDGGDQPGAEGTTPSPQAERRTEFSQTELDAMIQKRLRKAEESFARKQLAELGVESRQELEKILERARTEEPKPKTPQEREAEKWKAAVAGKERELKKQIGAVEKERDILRIEKLLRPALANARDSEAALAVVCLKRQHSFEMRDGKPIVVDEDGDKVHDDPVGWLTGELKKDEFRYLLRPAIDGTLAETTPRRRTSSSSKDDEIPRIDVRGRGGIASLLKQAKDRAASGE